MLDFIELLCRLADNKVQFVLVGGLAAAAYGSPQLTQDIDICIQLSIQNLENLKYALAGLHPVHRMHPSKPKFEDVGEKLKSFRNIYLDTDIGQLDCLGEIKGIGSFEDVMDNSGTIELRGKTIHILSLEALIKSKEALGRPKDKGSVLLLKVILEKREETQ